MDNEPKNNDKAPNSEYDKWKSIDANAAKEEQVMSPTKEEESLQYEERVHFKPIGEEDLATIAELESRIYPAETLQYGGPNHSTLRMFLGDPGSEKYSSVFESELGGVEQPVGYCIAHEQKSETHPDYEGKAVYVDDFALVPEVHGDMSITLEAFYGLLKRIEDEGIGLIEMEARKSTSYKLFKMKLVQYYLAKRGYIVTDHGLADDQWEGDDEETYWISLRKQDKQAEADQEAV